VLISAIRGKDYFQRFRQRKVRHELHEFSRRRNQSVKICGICGKKIFSPEKLPAAHAAISA